MSCHYSCSTCSSDTYYDQCLSCPITRQAIGTTCVCESGYFDRQTQTCTSSADLQNWEKSLSQINEIMFYVAIVLSWMSVFMTITRITNPKFKRIIDLIQIIALVSFYRFPYNTIAEGSLRVLSVYNFNYFSQLICTKQGPPTGCLIYQNILGPFMCLVGFCIIYLISFVLMKVFLYVQWIVFFKQSIWGFVFWYLDYTIIYNSVTIMRTIHSSYWAFFLVGSFLLLLIALLIKFYKIINDPDQILLSHRVTNSYFYLYDENYHLYYIDYLFDSEHNKHHNEPTSINRHMRSLQNSNQLQKVKSKYVSGCQRTLRPSVTKNRVANNELQNVNFQFPEDPGQQEAQRQKKQNQVVFFPKSNFLLFQMLFKCISAVVVVLLYSFKPLFFSYLLVIALTVQLFNLQMHFYYERIDIVIFFGAMIIYLFVISNYWDRYFTYIIFIVMLLSQLIICAYIIILSFTGCIKRSLLQKVYKNQQYPEQAQNQLQKVKQKQQKQSQNHPSDLLIYEQPQNFSHQSSDQTINPFQSKKIIKPIRKRRTNKDSLKKLGFDMDRENSAVPFQENQQPEN